MIQVALVGCAHIHTPGFVKRLQARSDVTVRYVWDTDVARARPHVEALGSQTAPSLDAVWNDGEIAGVIICSETGDHERLVAAGAAARKHLFVEKPLGIMAADAFRMASAIEKAGVLFQTGYFMRGQPAHQFLRTHIAQGTFGKITRIRHSNCHAGSLRGLFDTDWRWMADPARSGMGGFGDLGTHSLDIMLWLMGEPQSVTAHVGVATGRYGDCDEYGEGLLLFDGGAIGSLAAGWVDVAHPVSVLVSGVEGHAYVSNGQLFVHSANLPGADGKNPWTDLPPAWPHAFDLFLDAVGGADAPLVAAHEAAQRSSVMQALYEAARTHTWVTPQRRPARA